MNRDEPPVAPPTRGEAFRVWVLIGLNSFGGPAGQIGVMHRVLVEEKGWISERRFLHALNYCMLLPGPEAQQLATYIGWLLHRTWGGLVAGLLFVLPGFVAMLLLSIVYAKFQDWTVVDGIFFGIKPAVMAIVLQALVRIGQRALRTSMLYGIAAGAFVCIHLLDLPFPAIVLAAGAVGAIGGSRWPGQVPDLARSEHPAAAGDPPRAPAERVPWGTTLLTAALWLTIWLAPVAVLWLLLGRGHVFVEQSIFFSKTAVVTFGGAYAVLAYLAQQAVEHYRWLEPGEMLDGLGMAETTPGPLIMVLQFVGFMGAYRNPGLLDPLLAGVLGSVLATWVTFAPCFLWIFLGAPYVERLRNNRALGAALAGITAAVVGVILNLTVWFSLHVLFAETRTLDAGPVSWLVPVWGSIDVAAAIFAVASAVAVFFFRVGMIKLIAVAALAGMAYALVLT